MDNATGKFRTGISARNAVFSGTKSATTGLGNIALEGKFFAILHELNISRWHKACWTMKGMLDNERKESNLRTTMEPPLF